MKTHIEELRTKGFVTVPYPPDLRAAVVQTIELWQKFCSLSTVDKKSLPYSNGADGVGYELKEGVGNKGDRKENFDVTTAGKDWLAKNAVTIGDGVALNFIQSAASLAGLLKPAILDFARQIESRFGIESFVDEVETSESAYFVRFIHYPDGPAPGTETATAHVDQSGFTFHLFESAAGLQCLPYEAARDGSGWIDMPVSAGETVIIPSMQLQLRSQGVLRALAHRVISTEETVKTGRYSAVCFIQLGKTPKYNKEKYGRLQEKAPGFNYDMSHAEFAKLFKGCGRNCGDCGSCGK